MTNNKYEVHLIPPQLSDQKQINIIWKGDEKAEAWAAFFDYINHHATFKTGDTSHTAYVLQLIERANGGYLLVRTSFHFDAREWAYAPDRNDPTVFGYGMSMPRTERQQLIETAQDVLLRFVSTFGIDPDDTVTICETEKALQYNWLEWFHNYYLKRSKIFL